MSFNKEKIVLLDSLLEKLADDRKKQQTQKFFKTNKGDYAEKDHFLGVYVPDLKRIASEHQDLGFHELDHLISSKFNEKRLLALFILVKQYKKGDLKKQEKIYKFYLEHLKCVDNWNLVDSSAPYILGPHLFDRDKNLLFQLIQSESVWERRIGILATFYFIKNGRFETSFEIARRLLKDKHDLIHKALGWMLRTIGKKNIVELKNFLDEYSPEMPRTTLRYAIERFSGEEKELYMNK